MLENEQLIKGSLIQSTYDYIDQILKDFKKLQPEFKYDLFFGTNYDVNDIQDKDKFNIILFTGGVDKIPSHYIDYNGVNQMFYAGYLDVSLSIVNPISVSYSDELQVHSTDDKELTEDFNQQEEVNQASVVDLDDEDLTKIQKGTRMLEALSLFLTQRAKIVNDFKITSRADAPIIFGQFDYNVYRLQEQLSLMTKFVLLNDIGKSSISGEEYKIWFNFKENGEDNWLEYYEMFDYSRDEYLDNNEFPKSNNPNIQAIINHIGRQISITSPDFKIGANKKLHELTESGDIKKIKEIEIKIYDGHDYKKANVKMLGLNHNANRDKFASIRWDFKVVSNFEKVGG